MESSPLGISADFVLMRKVYNQEVGHLLRAIRQREVDLGVPPVMPREWAEMENRCHAAIALALLWPVVEHLVGYLGSLFKNTGYWAISPIMLNLYSVSVLDVK